MRAGIVGPVAGWKARFAIRQIAGPLWTPTSSLRSRFSVVARQRPLGLIGGATCGHLVATSTTTWFGPTRRKTR